MEVRAIVELDDYSHDGAERQAEDAARDAMLDEVGIPVHRFDARTMPDVAAFQACNWKLLTLFACSVANTTLLVLAALDTNNAGLAALKK